MFSSNEKISGRQAFRLLVFDLLGLGTLLIPAAVAGFCGRDGIFCIIVGTVLGLLFLRLLVYAVGDMQGSFAEYTEKMCGTFFGKTIPVSYTHLMVKCPILIAKPQISVSTKLVYENLKLDENTVHPDIDRLVEDIRRKDLAAITSDMGNVLETVTIPNYPVIAEIKEHMMEHGAAGAMMSGSGPTVFGLFDDKEKAVAAYEAMQASGLAKQVYLTSIYNNMR